MSRCEICDSDKDVKKCAVMTGVPFSAPDEQQRYVCHLCIVAWMEGAGTTRLEILQERMRLKVKERLQS